MSELMDRAVIGMPYEMAMADELSRRQFYARAQALLAERDRLRETLKGFPGFLCGTATGDKWIEQKRGALKGAQP